MTPEVGRVYRGKPDPDTHRRSTVYRVCVAVEDGAAWMTSLGDAEDPREWRRYHEAVGPVALERYWEATGYRLEEPS